MIFWVCNADAWSSGMAWKTPQGFKWWQAPSHSHTHTVDVSPNLRNPPWRSQSQREDFSGNPLFESNWLQFCWERYEKVAGHTIVPKQALIEPYPLVGVAWIPMEKAANPKGNQTNPKASLDANNAQAKPPGKPKEVPSSCFCLRVTGSKCQSIQTFQTWQKRCTGASSQENTSTFMFKHLNFLLHLAYFNKFQRHPPGTKFPKNFHHPAALPSTSPLLPNVESDQSDLLEAVVSMPKRPGLQQAPPVARPYLFKSFRKRSSKVVIFKFKWHVWLFDCVSFSWNHHTTKI